MCTYICCLFSGRGEGSFNRLTGSEGTDSSSSRDPVWSVNTRLSILQDTANFYKNSISLLQSKTHTSLTASAATAILPGTGQIILTFKGRNTVPHIFIYFGKTTSLFYVYLYISTQRPSSFPVPLARRRLSRFPRHRKARSPPHTSTHWNRAGPRYQNLQLNRGPQFKTQRQLVFQQPNMLTGYYT